VDLRVQVRRFSWDHCASAWQIDVSVNTPR